MNIDNTLQNNEARLLYLVKLYNLPFYLLGKKWFQRYENSENSGYYVGYSKVNKEVEKMLFWQTLKK